MKSLPKLSVVFISYNRLATLAPTLESFLDQTGYPRKLLELIVTDDGSPAHVRAAIRDMPFDVFVLSRRRTGLGANANRGLAAASGDYILQLQDDWECLGPADYLRRAVSVLEARGEIGMVILKPHPEQLGIEQKAVVAGEKTRRYVNEPWRRIERVGQHAYTDWPHLKRKSFVAHIGPYKESSRMWETELDYARRVNAQRRFFVADMEDIDAFQHIGEHMSFNRGSRRARLGKAALDYAATRWALSRWRGRTGRPGPNR